MPVFIAALLGAVVGAILILPLGLGLNELIVWPLALLVGGFLASLAAHWARAGRVARSRAHLTRLLIRTELAAFLMGVCLVLIMATPMRWYLFPPIVPIGIGVLAVATVATWAAARS
jgi:hypothetical protein